MKHKVHITWEEAKEIEAERERWRLSTCKPIRRLRLSSFFSALASFFKRVR